MLAVNKKQFLNNHFNNLDTLHDDLFLEHKRIINIAEEKFRLIHYNSLKTTIIESDIKTPYCVLKTNIPCSAPLLFEYLVEDIVSTMKDWNKVIQKATLIEKITENESIIQIISKVPILYAREDLFYQLRVKKGNTFYEFSTGVLHPEVPLRKNVVRCDLFFCSKEITEIDNHNSSYTVI